MARRERALCKDTTLTAGTGTYTLDGASAAGYQTLEEAVTRGLVANGDTIVYRVSDPSAPVVYEVAIGTVGSAGLTVSRDTILERDDGSTSPKSWPGGGTRNFVVTWWPGEYLLGANNLSDVASANTSADNIGAARLNKSPLFQEDQNANSTLYMRNDNAVGTAAAGVLVARAEARTLSVIAHGAGRTLTRMGIGVGSKHEILANAALLLSTTSGDVTMGAGGTKMLVLEAGGAVTDGAGSKFVKFPTGGTFELLANTVPTGWSPEYEADGRLLKVATSGDTKGGATGTNDFFSSPVTGSTVLTISQIPAHSHSLGGGGAVSFLGAGASSDYTTDAADPDRASQTQFYSNTDTAGSGAGHTHTIAVPKSRIFVRISLD